MTGDERYGGGWERRGSLHDHKRETRVKTYTRRHETRLTGRRQKIVCDRGRGNDDIWTDFRNVYIYMKFHYDYILFYLSNDLIIIIIKIIFIWFLASYDLIFKVITDSKNRNSSKRRGIRSLSSIIPIAADSIISVFQFWCGRKNFEFFLIKYDLWTLLSRLLSWI